MALTVKQVAKRLSVSPSLIYAMVAAGKLPSFRVGLGRGTIRIDESAVVEAIIVPSGPGPCDESAGAGMKFLRLPK